MAHKSHWQSIPTYLQIWSQSPESDFGPLEAHLATVADFVDLLCESGTYFGFYFGTQELKNRGEKK